jgi:hypothetical protein
MGGFEDLNPHLLDVKVPNLNVPGLELGELRSLRNRLQAEDDVVSYVRRIAQARCDVLAARFLEIHPDRSEAAEGSGEISGDITGDLGAILSTHLTGGPARPPRPVEPVDSHPLLDELERVCAEHGYSRAENLTTDELQALLAAITEFERGVSRNRQSRYEVLDALSAELVRRYRDGEANVDSLLDRDEPELHEPELHEIDELKHGEWGSEGADSQRPDSTGRVSDD